jgi:hypothetical protein
MASLAASIGVPIIRISGDSDSRPDRIESVGRSVAENLRICQAGMENEMPR